MAGQRCAHVRIGNSPGQDISSSGSRIVPARTHQARKCMENKSAHFALRRQANRSLLFEKGLAFPEEFGKPKLLVGDAVCDSRFVSSARKGGGLLGELSNIVADNRDTFVELHQGAVATGVSRASGPAPGGAAQG